MSPLFPRDWIMMFLVAQMPYDLENHSMSARMPDSAFPRLPVPIMTALDPAVLPERPREPMSRIALKAVLTPKTNHRINALNQTRHFLRLSLPNWNVHPRPQYNHLQTDFLQAIPFPRTAITKAKLLMCRRNLIAVQTTKLSRLPLSRHLIRLS